MGIGLPRGKILYSAYPVVHPACNPLAKTDRTNRQNYGTLRYITGPPEASVDRVLSRSASARVVHTTGSIVSGPRPTNSFPCVRLFYGTGRSPPRCLLTRSVGSTFVGRGKEGKATRSEVALHTWLPLFLSLFSARIGRTATSCQPVPRSALADDASLARGGDLFHEVRRQGLVRGSGGGGGRGRGRGGFGRGLHLRKLGDPQGGRWRRWGGGAAA